MTPKLLNWCSSHVSTEQLALPSTEFDSKKQFSFVFAVAAACRCRWTTTKPFFALPRQTLPLSLTEEVCRTSATTSLTFTLPRQVRSLAVCRNGSFHCRLTATKLAVLDEVFPLPFAVTLPRRKLSLLRQVFLCRHLPFGRLSRV